MGDTTSTAWRCLVCGYVHRGSEPPDFCPVCGAGQDEFEPYIEQSPRVESSPCNHWRCINCGYVHEGSDPPEVCPICDVGSDEFESAHELSPEAGAVKIKAVIVGGGVAGVSAAETIRKNSERSQITLIATESELPYYRLNLTRYLAGEIVRDTLPIHPEEWYAENRIELVRGISVKELDSGLRQVRLADGREFDYDKLILATGSHPYVPALDGVEKDGVKTLRTMADADAILSAVRDQAECVCIGGGVLGIETAGALARLGASVTLLESHEWLMPRQLNLRAAAMLERYMESLGVKVVKNARSSAIEGDQAANGVRLTDGRFVKGDLIVLATGVRPNTAIARKAGIEVDKGIVVDQHLRTSLPDVLAAGDVAEHNGQLYGAWGASQFQGQIAALNALGIDTPFGGIPRSNVIKLLGIDISSMGQFTPPDGSFIVLEDESPDSYATLVFHDGRLVGAILIGHPASATAVKAAIEGGREFSRLLSDGAGCRDILSELV